MAGGFVPFHGTEREEDLLVQDIRERFINVIGKIRRKPDFSGKTKYNHKRLKEKTMTKTVVEEQTIQRAGAGGSRYK